jgi:hypothetical protein
MTRVEEDNIRVISVTPSQSHSETNTRKRQKTSQCYSQPTVQSRRQTNINFVTPTDDRIIDNAISKYIIQCGLSHHHVESEALQDLMEVFEMDIKPNPPGQ